MKIALVTGASSGIGKVTAELFARGGYEVFGVSRSLKPESRRYKRIYFKAETSYLTSENERRMHHG